MSRAASVDVDDHDAMLALLRGVPAVAPPLTGRVLFDQRWTDLAFLHWPVDPELVAPYLPRRRRPDVLDGVSYVGLIPFHMRGAGPVVAIAAPYLGDFLETNVRLYGVDAAGRHGVVFRSLEASRLLTVLAARWGYRLPYVWSRMRVVRDGDIWTWSSRRRWPNRGLTTHIAVRVGAPLLAPTPLDIWLTARWGLHHRGAGRHDLDPERARGMAAAARRSCSSSPTTSWRPPVCRSVGLPPVPVRFTGGVRTVFGWPRPIAGSPEPSWFVARSVACALWIPKTRSL